MHYIQGNKGKKLTSHDLSASQKKWADIFNELKIEKKVDLEFYILQK